MSEMNKEYALGIDIGGSHLAIAIVDIANRTIIEDTRVRVKMKSSKPAKPMLKKIVKSITKCIKLFGKPIYGIGVSIPGPLDYENGVSKIYNCNKYDSFFGVNIKNHLYHKLKDYITSPEHIVFENDANCFVLGASWENAWEGKAITAITLGTGIGSGFMNNGEIVTLGDTVPPRGEVYNMPFKGKRAEDWISVNWFLNTYEDKYGAKIKNVKKIADLAETSEKSKEIFNAFGNNLGTFLNPVLEKFNTDFLVFGGSISKSYHLFQSEFEKCFNNKLPNVHISGDTEDAAIMGAVQKLMTTTMTVIPKRNTKQHLMPIHATDSTTEGYNVFPTFEINSGNIDRGYDSLAKEIANQKSVKIDGYLGVDWNEFIGGLTTALEKLGVESIAYSTDAAFKSEKEINEVVTPFLGGDDPIFGKIFPEELGSFFDTEKFKSIQPNKDCLCILYGHGAALSNWKGKLMYIDVPKNEIQYRSRAGYVFNLGTETIPDPKKQYKRMYFVDWPVLNKHKRAILSDVDYIIDGQYLSDVSWAEGNTLRAGLKEMSQNAFKARPWFESGVWGGDWMKERFTELYQDVINYAWSFELITPENGIVFSDKGTRLEVSFDYLMFFDNKAILGDAAETFGTSFPIRFNYLDTFNGENLSLQCHPTQEFIRSNFGEKFTQDETYYIADAGDDAVVYLGFQEDINKNEFHNALIESNAKAEKMDVEKYVQVLPAKKHDLFLIPNGTIHCSGINNLVLEISSTTYIFTFKMYDWMRLDLDGKPRPLNIERGMQNVNFECKGDAVQNDYVSKEAIVTEGNDWIVKNLSTHPKHFYEINRFEFDTKINVKTNNQCHILNLVEGESIKVTTGDRSMVIYHAETFVVPSNAKEYKIENLGKSKAKVVQSNVKPAFCDTRFD